MTSKALMLAAAMAVAACSRNPKPETDETGRADTTSFRPDTTMRTDTSMVRPDTAMAPPDTSAWRDTMSAPVDTSGIKRDTVQHDTTNVPYPRE